MKTVRIVHPEAGEADVPASAVPHWRSSGWTPASELEQDAATDKDAGGKQDDKPSGRSRRRSSEGDE